MSDWYNETGAPSTGSQGSSATMRNEFTAISDAMDKLPTLTGNGAKVVVVNAGGTALEATSTLTVSQGGTGAATLTDGGVLLGSGTGAVTAMAVLADGQIIIGDGVTDPTTLSAFTSSTGTLKHEYGGLEANISAVVDGDFIVGTGAGTIGLESGATVRDTMGLGSIATQDSDNVTITGGSITGLTEFTGPQHVGIGAAPDLWGSTYTTTDLSSGSVFGYSDEMNIGVNIYETGGGFKYKGNGYGVRSLWNEANGSYSIFTAPNNVSGAGASATLTERMTLDVSGNLVIDGRLITNSADSTNVAVGTGTLASKTSATDNVAIGYGALTAATTSSDNVAIGYSALTASTTGGGNVAVGSNALKLSTTGYSNVAIGSNALDSITTGAQNIAIGYSSGQLLISSNNTVFIGHQSGLFHTGDDNVAIGSGSLADSGSGHSNVAIGSSSLAAVTSGTNNSAVGYSAGNTTTTGSNNSFLGNGAAATSATVNNEITLGNSSIATLRCQVTTITALSDERDKKNIENLNLGIDFINSLTPRKFTWNMRDGAKVDIEEAGFIAQELDNASYKFDADWVGLVYKENPERLEASPGKLIPILVKAVQELSNEINKLKQNAGVI